MLAPDYRNEPGRLRRAFRFILATFLDQWLEQVRTQVSPRTYERYEELARKNIAPLLGQALLTKLRAAQITAAYAKALETGRRSGQGGLAPRTVHHMHRILRQALALAVKWDYLARNPADDVEPPKVERRKMRALDTDETAALIAHFRPTRILCLCYLRDFAGSAGAKSQP